MSNLSNLQTLDILYKQSHPLNILENKIWDVFGIIEESSITLAVDALLKLFLELSDANEICSDTQIDEVYDIFFNSKESVDEKFKTTMGIIWAGNKPD